MRPHRLSGCCKRSLFSLLAVPLLLSPPQGTPPQGRETEEEERIRTAIQAVQEIRLRMNETTPHDILRGIFTFGKEFKVYEKEGDTFVPGVEYLLREARFKGRRIFREKKGEVLVVSPGRERGKVQDLPDEILMVLALAGVGLDEKIRVSDEKEVTVKDLLETAKKRVDPSRELSCSIVAFAIYVPWGESWALPRSKKKLSMEKLLKASLQKNPAAYLDDGAYHLFALSHLLKKWKKEGGMPKSVEKAITDRLAQRRSRSKGQQTGEGGLGFLGVGALQTTAIHLNWIVISAPWAEVHQPWVDRAALWLAEELRRAVKRGKPGYGTLAIAARALLEYSALRYPEPG